MNDDILFDDKSIQCNFCNVCIVDGILPDILLEYSIKYSILYYRPIKKYIDLLVKREKKQL